MALMEDLDKETVEYIPTTMRRRKSLLFSPQNSQSPLQRIFGHCRGNGDQYSPHNLKELIKATQLVIDNPEVTTDTIMEVMPGPDFPTGGMICGYRGIKEAFHTGRGKLMIRGLIHVEDQKGNDRQRVVIDELPYNVNKSRLIERLADLVNNKAITGVSDIRDESDKQGMRVVIDLKRGEIPDVIINQLYKFTDMQVTFGCNMWPSTTDSLG